MGGLGLERGREVFRAFEINKLIYASQNVGLTLRSNILSLFLFLLFRFAC